MTNNPVITVLLLNFLAMTGLSLAMTKHHQQLVGGVLTAARVWSLRLLAILLMGLALYLMCTSWGVASGIVLWIGLLSVGTFASVFLLSSQKFRVVSLLLGCALTSLLMLA